MQVLEPLPPDVVGYHVENSSPSLLFRRDIQDIADHLYEYLRSSGVPSQQAVIIPMGAAAGGPDASAGFWVPAFNFVKPISLSIQAVKFLLAWRARMASRARRLLFPRITVALFASHIEPVRQTPTEIKSFDAATHLIVMLPELRKELEEAFPALNFRYEIHARTCRSKRVVLRTGDGLPLSDSHVLKMLKLLEQDSMPSVTIFHREGWFALPEVVAVKMRFVSALDPRLSRIRQGAGRPPSWDAPRW